jgi:hypothetical protein
MELRGRPSNHSIRGCIAFSAALAVSVACAIPPGDIPSEFRTLHTDWFYVLHAAAAAGIVFGRDLHFTYGPLGFLALPQYHPQTWGWMLGAWSVLGLAGGAIWWSHLRALRETPWLRAALVWIAMGVATAQPLRDAFAFTLALLMILGSALGSGSRPRWQQPAGAFALGLLSLTKFTFFLSGAAAVLLATIFELARRRRLDPSPLVYAATVLGLWTAVTGSPASIADHVKTSLEISSGYASAMGHPRDGTGGGAGDLLGFGVATILLIGAAVRGTPRLRPFHAVSLGLIFYFVWKAAFVRHDLPHVMIAAEFVLLAAVAIGAAAKEQTGKLPSGPMALAAVLGLMLAGSGWGISASELTDPTLLVRLPLRNSAVAASRIFQPEKARRQWAEWNLHTRRTVDLSATGEGTIDFYPWGQSIAFAWDLPVRSRPIPQSYAAFTSDLAELNAAHLRGKRGAEWLVFGIETIDDRWPAGDDAPSWLEILGRYDGVGRSSGFLLLRRRTIPHHLELTRLISRDVEPRRRYDLSRLPPEPLWISFDFRQTAAGSLAGLLLRPTPVHLRVLISGEERPRLFRIVPDTASAGFLLSPFIEDADGFAALAAGERLEKRPLWLEIETGSPSGLWERRVPMTLDRISLPSADWRPE